MKFLLKTTIISVAAQLSSCLVLNSSSQAANVQTIVHHGVYRVLDPANGHTVACLDENGLAAVKDCANLTCIYHIYQKPGTQPTANFTLKTDKGFCGVTKANVSAPDSPFHFTCAGSLPLSGKNGGYSAIFYVPGTNILQGLELLVAGLAGDATKWAVYGSKPFGGEPVPLQADTWGNSALKEYNIAPDFHPENSDN